LHQPDEQETPKNDDEDRRGLLNQEICRVARSSIDPATDIDPPGRDIRTSDDHGTAACANAASPIHTARADEGACFHRAQCRETSQQQQRDDHVFHCFSPKVVIPGAAMEPMVMNTLVSRDLPPRTINGE
jgi:hypothetical protein